MENYDYRYEIRIGLKEKEALEKLKNEGINTSQLLRDYIIKKAYSLETEKEKIKEKKEEKKSKTHKEKKEIKDKITRLKNRLSIVAYHLQNVVLERNKHIINHPYDEEKQSLYNNSIQGLTAEKEEIKQQIQELKEQLKD